MVNGTSEERSWVLWAVSNYLLNSQEDCLKIIESGIFTNISLALRDCVRTVKGEAIYCIANVICFLDDSKVIRDLLVKNEIDSCLMNYLKEEESAHNIQVIFFMYMNLF